MNWSELNQAKRNPAKAARYIKHQLLSIPERYQFKAANSIDKKKFTSVGPYEMVVYDNYNSYISRKALQSGDGLYKGIVSLLDQVIEPGHRVIDIGAHIGYFSLFMAGGVGGSGEVVAIEPHPRNYNLLRTNICLNDFNDTIHTQNVALSNKLGERDLFIHPTNHGGHSMSTQFTGDRITVPTRVGDDEWTTPFDFIKIDVEGHERKVIEGFRSHIDQHEPLILFEYDSTHWANGDVEIICDILSDKYQFWTVASDTGKEDLINLSDLSSMSRTNVLAEPIEH